MEQILVTVHHDGRFGTKEGRKKLAQMISQYIWNMEGANVVEADLVPDDKVMLSRPEYEQLRALKDHHASSAQG